VLDVVVEEVQVSDRGMDPLSIAGLTVAVFDELIKIGDRTAELISDARSFKDVSDISLSEI